MVNGTSGLLYLAANRKTYVCARMLPTPSLAAFGLESQPRDPISDFTPLPKQIAGLANFPVEMLLQPKSFVAAPSHPSAAADSRSKNHYVFNIVDSSAHLELQQKLAFKSGN